MINSQRLSLALHKIVLGLTISVISLGTALAGNSANGESDEENTKKTVISTAVVSHKGEENVKDTAPAPIVKARNLANLPDPVLYEIFSSLLSTNEKFGFFGVLINRRLAKKQESLITRQLYHEIDILKNKRILELSENSTLSVLTSLFKKKQSEELHARIKKVIPNNHIEYSFVQFQCKALEKPDIKARLQEALGNVQTLDFPSLAEGLKLYTLMNLTKKMLKNVHKIEIFSLSQKPKEKRELYQLRDDPSSNFEPLISMSYKNAMTHFTLEDPNLSFFTLSKYLKNFKSLKELTLSDSILENSILAQKKKSSQSSIPPLSYISENRGRFSKDFLSRLEVIHLKEDSTYLAMKNKVAREKEILAELIEKEKERKKSIKGKSIPMLSEVELKDKKKIQQTINQYEKMKKSREKLKEDKRKAAKALKDLLNGPKIILNGEHIS